MALDVNNNVAYSGVFIQSPENRRRVQEQARVQESASVKNDVKVDLKQDTSNVELQSEDSVSLQDDQGSFTQKAQIYETAKNYFDGLKSSAAKLGKAAVYVQTATQGSRQAAQDMLGFETYA